MPGTKLHPCSKHNCGGTIINIFDKRAIRRWTSLDPSGERALTGDSVIDLYPLEVRDEAFKRISEWIVSGKSDSWVVQAHDWRPGKEKKVQNWKITVYPLDHGELAGLSLSTILPDNYFDLTEDDLTLLRLLVADKGLKEIATEMDRSASATDARVKSLKKKLGCKTSAGLAAKAVWCHLVPDVLDTPVMTDMPTSPQ